MQEETKTYIQTMKSNGHNDAAIVDSLTANGWSQIDAQRAVATQSMGSAARKDQQLQTGPAPKYVELFYKITVASIIYSVASTLYSFVSGFSSGAFFFSLIVSSPLVVFLGLQYVLALKIRSGSFIALVVMTLYTALSSLGIIILAANLTVNPGMLSDIPVVYLGSFILSLASIISLVLIYINDRSYLK